MLKQRIITALALLAVLLPALFADSPQPFLLLSILMIGAGAWEWGNMNGMSSRQSILSGVICVDLCIFAWWAGWTTSTDAWVWWMAGASWVGLTAWMLQRGVQGWALWHRDLRWLLGFLLLHQLLILTLCFVLWQSKSKVLNLWLLEGIDFRQSL